MTRSITLGIDRMNSAPQAPGGGVVGLKDLGDIVRASRLSQGLTQQEVASRVGDASRDTAALKRLRAIPLSILTRSSMPIEMASVWAVSTSPRKRR